MDRRHFIRNTSLSVLGLSLLDTETVIITSRQKKIITGAHVWVYAASLPNYDVSPVLSQIFSDVAYAGFDGVELMEQPLRSAIHTKQIGELIQKNKISLIGCSYSADMWDKNKHSQIYEDVDKIFNNLSSVNGRTFGVTVGKKPGNQKKTEEDFDNQADILKRIISLGKEKGIVLNLHNHTFEVEYNMYDLKGTLKRIPGIKLGPDLNWLLRAGVDPIDFLREFGPQINFLHLRDQLNKGKWPESLGEGDVDFAEIASVLKEIKFEGDAIVELAHEGGFKPTRELRQSLKMSRDFMKKKMGI